MISIRGKEGKNEIHVEKIDQKMIKIEKFQEKIAIPFYKTRSDNWTNEFHSRCQHRL